MLKNGDLENILTRVQQWTWQVDQKVNVLLAAQVAGLGLLVSPLSRWFTSAGNGYRFFIFAGALLYLAGIYNAVRCLFPDTTNPHEPPSITFFGHIAATPFDEYAEKIGSISDEEYRRDFVTQIHVCSQIVRRKFHHFALALLLSGIGLAALGLSYWAYTASL